MTKLDEWVAAAIAKESADEIYEMARLARLSELPHESDRWDKDEREWIALGSVWEWAWVDTYAELEAE